MALNNLTRVTGSGFGTDTSINTAGIITATSFSGDGSALTGVVGSGSGVVVQEEGSNVGTAQTINFIGTGVTATLSGGIASIEITTSSGGGGGLSDVVSDTTPQLGGNLDINGKDVTGTGGVNLTGVITATTFVGALTGNASGNAATATTLQNASTIGGVSFDGSTNINLPGVNAAGNQDTSGTASIATNVTVADESSDTSCFLLYSTEATGNIAPKTGSNLIFNSSNGTLSASTFVGDGSGLTGITASGSGVIVRDGGSLVGTAGTIDFGTNVSVSPISAGVVTVTAAAGTIVGINTSGTTELNNLTVAGVATANSFSGSGSALTTLNASELDSGTIPDARFPATLPAVSGANLTNLPAANITGTLPAISGANLTNLDASDLASGTIPDARFPATLPAASGANLTNLPAANITGTLPAISGANLTNLPSDTPADTDVQVTYDISSNGSSAYLFTGPGYSGADDNPDIYLVRGQRYRFINTTGTGHPFRIQSDTSGTAYTDGVSGDQDGTQDFNVQHDAPVRLYYQCTIHSGMIGNIYVVGASDWRMTDVATSATPEIFTNLNVGFESTSKIRLKGSVSNGTTHAHLNIGSDSSNSETRAIDIYGGWSEGEYKSINYNHGTGTADILAQQRVRYKSSPSSTYYEIGRFYHGQNTTAYPIRFVSTGVTTADLELDGNLKVSSGNGINFSAYATSGNPSSNLLDDYEEGTFLPTMFGSTVAGTSTYSLQYGYYVKVGKLVHIQIRMTVASSTATGYMRIGGLPFVSLNDANRGYASINVSYANNISLPSGSTWMGAYTSAGGSSLVLIGNTPGSVVQQVSVDTSWVALIGGTYIANV